MAEPGGDHEDSLRSRVTAVSLDAIFKAYDIRGTVPDQLDARRSSRAIGAAFARFAKPPLAS